MRARAFLRFVAVSGFSTSLLACATAGDEANEPAKDDPSEDVTRSVAAFPEAEVVQAADDGVPTRPPPAARVPRADCGPRRAGRGLRALPRRRPGPTRRHGGRANRSGRSIC